MDGKCSPSQAKLEISVNMKSRLVLCGWFRRQANPESTLSQIKPQSNPYTI